MGDDPESADPTAANQVLKRLFSLSARYRREVAVVFLLQIVLLGLGLVGLSLSGLAIDVTRSALDRTAPAPHLPFGLSLPESWTTRAVLFSIGSLVLGMAAARAGLSYLYSVQVGKLLHLKLVPELRTRVFDKLQRLSFRFFDENASGSIINRVTGDVQSVRSFVDGVLLQGAIMILSLCLYLVYMLGTHLGLTLACLALTPLLWFFTTLFSRWVRPAYTKNRELNDDMVLAMSEGIHGIQVTKVFGREAIEFERFREKNRAVMDQQQRIFERVSRFGPTVHFITQLDIAVLLLYGGYLVLNHGLTIGQLIVFAGLLQQFSGQVSSMAGIINTLQQSLAGARRVFEVLDAPLEVESPPSARRLGRARGAVRFESIQFSYRPGEPVLRGVDLEVEEGACVAIFGRTGAGKSTLLSLIPRFYEVDSGRVLLDGVDVRDLDLDDLRRNIGLVFQENLLFRSSVAQNIAFGHPEAPRAAVERAARTAGADEFIRALPQGYDTILEEAAVNLSGGQRQRIAIARALLPEPRVLLLDDPTTAVDPETEHELVATMQSAMRGRTTFVVANRPALLRQADLIVVLDRGRIVERGTHQELWRRGGLYFRAASAHGADAESRRLLALSDSS